MAGRWRNTGFFQIRRTSGYGSMGCAGGTPPSRAAVFLDLRQQDLYTIKIHDFVFP